MDRSMGSLMLLLVLRVVRVTPRFLALVVHALVVLSVGGMCMCVCVSGGGVVLGFERT